MLSKVLWSIVKSEQGGMRHKIEEEMDVTCASSVVSAVKRRW